MKDVDPKPLENEILIHTPKIISQKQESESMWRNQQFTNV